MLHHQELWRLEDTSRVYVDSLVSLSSSKDNAFIKVLSLNKARHKVDVLWKDKFPSVDGDIKFADKVKSASLFSINPPGSWTSDSTAVPAGILKIPGVEKFLTSKPNDERRSYVRLY